VAKQLTVKEAKLVKAKVKGKTHVEAAKEAGYLPNASDRTIQTEVYETLKKPHVKEALDRALVKHGITLDTAIAPIGKGLHAMKQNEFTGEITEDIKLQLQASDRALKLMGVGQSKDDVTTQNFIQINNEIRNKYV
jgi:phage terminase small subunit